MNNSHMLKKNLLAAAILGCSLAVTMDFSNAETNGVIDRPAATLLATKVFLESSATWKTDFRTILTYNDDKMRWEVSFIRMGVRKPGGEFIVFLSAGSPPKVNSTFAD